MGNVRVTFDQNGSISQETGYYPFGMTINSLSHTTLADNKKNPYLYNDYLRQQIPLDKEFGLQWYHYGFRMYDPVLGRFPSLDPNTNKNTKNDGTAKFQDDIFD